MWLPHILGVVYVQWETWIWPCRDGHMWVIRNFRIICHYLNAIAADLEDFHAVQFSFYSLSALPLHSSQSKYINIVDKSIPIIAESKAPIISVHEFPFCLAKLFVSMQRLPERIVEKAVKGMLPKGRLGRQLFNHLKVFKGSKHPHQAQKAKDVTNIINLKPEQLAKALTPNTGI